MTVPQTWEELLQGPAFLINMDRQTERLESSTRRLDEAGFTDVRRWRATDGLNDDIPAAWRKHGSPKFDPTDAPFVDLKWCPFKQGTLLSHLDVWKHIIDTNIPYAVIFEDDIVFHKDWKELGPAYYQATPKDYEMCYMGHHCGCGQPYQILKIPVYCTHAYILTKAGAKTLYDRILNDKEGVRTVDCQINHFMVQSYHNMVPFLTWYVWNGELFPDETARKHPEHAHKDMGLIFQEWPGV